MPRLVGYAAIILTSDKAGPRSRLILFGAALAVLGSGCKTTLHSGPGAAPTQAARIHHVVLLKLVDTAGTAALLMACDDALADIPVVQGYWSGTPEPAGRANVDRDYDIALHVGFASDADYEAYIAHPDHQALIAAWRDRLRWIHIYDASGIGETPPTSGSRSPASD